MFPQDHQRELLEKFPNAGDRVWILFYLCETYGIPIDFKYEPKVQGWTFRIKGALPSDEEGKLVYFSGFGEAVQASHELLQLIFVDSSNIDVV